MKTLNYKSFAFILVVLCAIGYVSALSIGNSIHLNITIDNSTSTDTTNNTNTNTNTDTTPTNQQTTHTNTHTTSIVDNSDNTDTTDSESDSSSTDSNNDPSSLTDNSVNQDPTENDNLVTGASVTSTGGLGKSNIMKFMSIIPTIVLAVIFICTYMLYRRKIDEEDIEPIKNKSVKKRIVKKKKK